MAVKILTHGLGLCSSQDSDYQRTSMAGSPCRPAYSAMFLSKRLSACVGRVDRDTQSQE